MTPANQTQPPEGTLRGIHRHLPFETYDAQNGFNGRRIRWILQSPKLMRYREENPEAATPQMRIGMMLHSAVLEPRRMADEFCVIEGSKVTKKHQDNNPGRIVLTQSEFGKGAAMACRARESWKARVYLNPPDDEHNEVSLFWVDRGILCMARPDSVKLVNGTRIMTQLKSGASCARDDFSRTIFNFGYHVDAAWMLHGWKMLTGEDLPYVFVCVENHPPHDVFVWNLDENSRRIGLEVAMRAFEKYRECSIAGEWPGRQEAWSPDYDTKVESIGIPTWAVRQYEEQSR